jgi:chromosome segregation ATPase
LLELDFATLELDGAAELELDTPDDDRTAMLELDAVTPELDSATLPLDSMPLEKLLDN